MIKKEEQEKQSYHRALTTDCLVLHQCKPIHQPISHGVHPCQWLSKQPHKVSPSHEQF